MHPWIARNLIYFPVQAFRGEKVGRFMDEIRAFHDEPLERKREIQWNKLLQLLDHVYRHNEYYRKLFDANGVDVRRLNDPADFRKIPFLTKEAIRNGAGRMISGGSGRVSSRKTSGSTGIPLVFSKDRDATAYMDALMYIAYGCHGVEIGDRQGRIWGIPLDFKGRAITKLKDLLLNRKRLNSFDITEESCSKYFTTLKRFRPAFIYGLVNTTAEFTDHCQRLGLNLGQLGLKAVITTGEILHDRSRKLLEDAFQCEVVNEYGTTENGIIAFECVRAKMHLFIHNIYVEFINPETGVPVSPGEYGEVVLTELHSYRMPFIRYRVGDLVRPSADRCDCELELPLIDEVVGRQSDLIVTPDGRKVSSAILSYSMPDNILQFRSYQRAVDQLDVLVVKSDRFGDDDLSLIERRIRTYLGDDIRITVNLTNSLKPEKTGKFRHFVSELGEHSHTNSV